MKVLHLDSGRELRGGQRQLQLLARGLEARGVETVLLTGDGLAEPGAEKLSLGNIRRAAKTADIIHAHDARSHTLAVIASAAPLVVSRRVAFPLRRGLLSSWKYAQPALFLAVSEFVAGRLRSAGVDPKRIRVVPDGVEVPSSPPALAASSAPRAGILEIADKLKLSDLAKQACNAAGVEPFVDGSLDSVLRNSDFLVYLTAEEGLGSALIAAAAQGRPAVASRVGGVPEAVDDGKTGLLVDNDVAAVAAAIRRFSNDPAFLASCSSRAFERAKSRFSSDIMVTQTLEAYRELLPD